MIIRYSSDRGSMASLRKSRFSRRNLACLAMPVSYGSSMGSLGILETIN